MRPEPHADAPGRPLIHPLIHLERPYRDPYPSRRGSPVFAIRRSPLPMPRRVTMIRRPTSFRSMGIRLLCGAVAGFWIMVAGPAAGVEILPAAKPAAAKPAFPVADPVNLPPQVLGDFTRRVQPLVLNRCASGACHGNPQGPEPHFIRSDPRGGIDHRSTQANLRAFLEAIGPTLEISPLAAVLAAGHPKQPASSRLVAAPLSPQERVNLERWLGGVRHAERRWMVDPAVQQASALAPAPPQPNRFQALLEAAANPPELPPPQEPTVVIFPKDAPPE